MARLYYKTFTLSMALSTVSLYTLNIAVLTVTAYADSDGDSGGCPVSTNCGD